MTPSLEAIAYHKAGHAVASFVRRHPFCTVTIKPTKYGEYTGYSGRDEISREIRKKLNEIERGSENKEKWVEDEMVIVLAGPHAERLATPKRDNAIEEDSHYEHAKCLAECVTESDREAKAYIELVSIRAEQLVDHHLWKPCIEAVAKELLARETLSEEEVKAAIINTFEARRRKSETK